jgi:hypothetical protein
MLCLTCTVCPEDKLTSYPTRDSQPFRPLFALVSESENVKEAGKVSVYLDTDQAKLLVAQLTAFINKQEAKEGISHA